MPSCRVSIFALAALCLRIVLPEASFARDFRVGMVPNGGQFSCSLCHISPGGGGTRNAFGSDVEAIIGGDLGREFWGPTLAGLDSDGDGFTNGQELGDPDGDGTPTPGVQVTHPADSGSRPENSAPQVEITKPANGSTFANTVAIAVEASASDPGGAVASVVFRDGAASLATKISAPFTHTIPAGTLSAGSHTLTAVATDNLGVMTISDPITITITITAPNQAPVVSIVQPTAGKVFVRPQVVRVEITASDADGSVARVEFLRGTNLLSTVTAAPYVLLVNTATAALGTFDVTARVVDDRGATTTSAPISFTILSELRMQAALVKPSGVLDLTWPSPAGLQFVVESSTNLTSWTQAGTITSTSQGARFTETPAANSPRKFYRVRLPQ